MTEKPLFDALLEQPAPERPLGKPRLLEPQRDQMELRSMDINSLIGEEHPARAIWDYAEAVDLSELEDAIKAREGTPGHPAITPRLLLAVWLYATSDGVGSARALARLCESHDAYRWLMGGVSVNYHTLSDFRVNNGKLLDRLLTENVATLAACDLIDLDKLAQDGVRVRASAGAASFRRRKTLEEHLARAHEVVQQLKREVHDDPAASNQRIRAARERAARERVEKVKAALKTLGEVEAQRARRMKTNQADREAEGAAGLDDRPASADHQDGGRRLSPGLEHAGRVGRWHADRGRGQAFHHWLGPRPHAADAGQDPQVLRPAAAPSSRRWRVCSGRRHRMGAQRGGRYLLSADQAQERQRSVPTAAQRRSRRACLARPNEE